MKKFWNILRKLSGDNRGGGIVVVLVTMTCVALMGASVLFMSYTAFAMRATERQASKDFYSAETAMEEIRAGVQTVASDAIAVAYKAVLEEYGKGSDVNRRFETAFMTALMKSALLSDDDTYKTSFLQKYVVGGRMVLDTSNSDPDADPEYITPVSGGTVKVRSDSHEVDGGDSITLKNVCVIYTATNGDETTITSDLVIDMPKLAYTTSAASITGLPQHAMIADKDMLQRVGNSEINISGSAYVGGMQMHGSGSKMTIENGTFVCAETVSVGGDTNGGRLVTGDDVKLWAGRIEVNGGSAVSLSGETYVLDDLELAGTSSQATLTGSYYGFGDGTPDSGSGDPLPSRSSAILVNGRDSTLNVSGLNRMMLAGRAYISNSLFPGSDEQDAASVSMIESVAVRVNQQMYLIDPADLEMAINDGSEYVPVTQNPILTEEKPTVRLKNNNFEPVFRSYKYFGQWLTYCFIDLGDPVVTEENSAKHIAANEYFEKRFSQNSSQINGYLGNSSNLNAGGVGTLGYTIRGKDGNYTFSRANGVIFDCAGMRGTFEQLKKTLVDYNVDPGANITPYKYIVKTSEVSLLDNDEPQYFMGPAKDPNDENQIITAPVGIIVDNPSSDDTNPTDHAYVVDEDTPSTVRVIIASGNVVVDDVTFTGLIIAGGNITISGDTNIKAAPDEVIKAFSAKNGTISLGSYLRGGETNYYGESVFGEADGWHLNTLVTYKNWLKN